MSPWSTSVKDRFKAITTIEAEAAVTVLLHKKQICEQSELDTVAHTQNGLCNQKN